TGNAKSGQEVPCSCSPLPCWPRQPNAGSTPPRRDHFSAGGVLGLGLVIGNLGAPAGIDTSLGLQTSNSALFASICF
ncbi:MAG TPA: hypothetical protein VIR81_05785, partial [Myxococcales bacterium]